MSQLFFLRLAAEKWAAGLCSLFVFFNSRFSLISRLKLPHGRAASPIIK